MTDFVAVTIQRKINFQDFIQIKKVIWLTQNLALKVLNSQNNMLYGYWNLIPIKIQTFEVLNRTSQNNLGLCGKEYEEYEYFTTSMLFRVHLKMNVAPK